MVNTFYHTELSMDNWSVNNNTIANIKRSKEDGKDLRLIIGRTSDEVKQHDPLKDSSDPNVVWFYGSEQLPKNDSALQITWDFNGPLFSKFLTKNLENMFSMIV